MHRLCAEARIDPAHLIPRSLGGCGEPLCVVQCAGCADVAEPAFRPIAEYAELCAELVPKSGVGLV